LNLRDELRFCGRGWSFTLDERYTETPRFEPVSIFSGVRAFCPAKERFMSRYSLPSRLVVAVVVLATFACAQSHAQQRRSPFGASRVSLGTLEPVREALKLNDEQKKLADTLHDQLMEDRRDVFQNGNGDFDAMRVEMEKLDADATGKFIEKLDDTQKARLTEIYVQANGPNSLADQAVIDSLKITEDQKSKLDEIRQTNRDSFFDMFQDFGDMSDEERREAITKLQQEGDDRLLKGLTDEQRTAFEKLTGEEVDYDLSQLRGGFGGGGGGGQRPAAGASARPQRPE
jgi:hypothetical protein